MDSPNSHIGQIKGKKVGENFGSGVVINVSLHYLPFKHEQKDKLNIFQSLCYNTIKIEIIVCVPLHWE